MGYSHTQRPILGVLLGFNQLNKFYTTISGISTW